MTDLPADDPTRSLPDELDVSIAQHKEDAETTVRNIVWRTGISFIPYAGSAINEIANGLAQLRVQERLNDVFDADEGASRHGRRRQDR